MLRVMTRTSWILAAVLVLFFQGEAQARTRHSHHSRQTGPAPVQASIVVDAETGAVLQASNADAITHPASLTKMMTLYMLFDQMASGRVRLDQRFEVSEHGAAQAPSKLGLQPGQTIRVEDAILALVTKSANDVAATIAENLGGSESAFAAQMTTRARTLGMSRTVFRNASGLPDPGQVTTARDMATLGRALWRNHRRYYGYFATRSFEWNGDTITSHNRLMLRYNGADGIKTGYIRASGFNLVSSAERDGRRLVAAVMGGRSAPSRDRHMEALLDAAFGGRAITRPAHQVEEANAEDDEDEQPAPKLTPPKVAAAEPAKPQPVKVEAKPEPPKPAKPQPTKVAAKAEKVEKADKPKPAPAVSPAPAPAGKPEMMTDSKGRQIAVLKLPTGKRPEAEGDSDGGRWGVQLGAYAQESSARNAVERLTRHHASLVADARAVVTPTKTGKTTMYRARVVGMTESQARTLCRKFTGDQGCHVLQPGA
jgi:D-alanyl-D-alanine carboxypeptidase